MDGAECAKFMRLVNEEARRDTESLQAKHAKHQELQKDQLVIDQAKLLRIVLELYKREKKIKALIL